MSGFCKKCLLRDMAEEDAGHLERYREAIKPGDRVDDEEYERRLSVCKECDLLNLSEKKPRRIRLKHI